MAYLLFGTSGCHLCDEAEKMITVNKQQITFATIDIAEQTQWYEKYAVNIPVLLHNETGAELFWPFTETDVDEFIRAVNLD